jgi:hypothetical protein
MRHSQTAQQIVIEIGQFPAKRQIKSRRGDTGTHPQSLVMLQHVELVAHPPVDLLHAIQSFDGNFVHRLQNPVHDHPVLLPLERHVLHQKLSIPRYLRVDQNQTELGGHLHELRRGPLAELHQSAVRANRVVHT